MPTVPGTPSLCRACSSAAKGDDAQTSLRGLSLISTSTYTTRMPSSPRRTLQGVPLEALGLSTCLSTSHAVRLLSEIVVDVWGPAETFEVEDYRHMGLGNSWPFRL